jgi:hypothetical protein
VREAGALRFDARRNQIRLKFQPVVSGPRRILHPGTLQRLSRREHETLIQVSSTRGVQMRAEASADQAFPDVEQGTVVCAEAIEAARSSPHLSNRR